MVCRVPESDLVSICLHMVLAYDRQSDRRTDRQTASPIPESRSSTAEPIQYLFI